MKKTTMKSLLLAGLLTVGVNGVWADDWSTVWQADFSSAPTGMTYSVTNGSVDISTGVLFYHQGGGSGNRAINTAFTDNAFKVDTNWKMEFDWGASSSNTNPSNVAFATNNGIAFTITWEKYATTVTITDANSNELTNTLPIDGYNKSTMTNLSHFTITGDTENGIYLTVTNGTTTYVDNVLVSSTYGYPSTFNGSLGRAVSHMALDNIVFQTPAVAGFVAAPTYTITAPLGTSRKFTLETLTEGASIYYSETELTVGAEGWIEYISEVTTSAETIYAYAAKGNDVSDITSFATGAGTEISLIAPSIFISSMVENGNLYNAAFNASSNQSSISFNPTAAISASFTPNGGSEQSVNLPYTATQNGTLSVTTSAAGYASTTTQIEVSAAYTKTWESVDYSTITEENITDLLDEDWAKLATTDRWASWDKNKTYTYFGHGAQGASNMTIDGGRLRMREVILINMGYGLGRNITGGEAITILNMANGEIAGFNMYNGYGNAVENNNYMSYSLCNGTSPSVNTNNGNLLIQASVFSPAPSVTITSAGYASFSCAQAVAIPEGVTAYYAVAKDAENVTLKEIETGYIAAEEGIVFKGNADTYTLAATTENIEKIEGNLLKPWLTDGTPNESVYYTLAAGPSFKKSTGGVLAAGKAYLVMPNSNNAPQVNIIFDGTATGIQTVSNVNANNRIYNLQGQRVSQPQKGLYIIDGKKVVLK